MPTNLPPAPDPVLIERPADAEQQLAAALEALNAKLSEVAVATHEQRYPDVRALLKQMPALEYRVHAASQVAEHGDLNVDELVAGLLPKDYEWFSKTSLYGKLAEYDQRLQGDRFSDPSAYRNTASAPEIVIARLLERGKLRRHGGSYDLLRHSKPGDK